MPARTPSRPQGRPAGRGAREREVPKEPAARSSGEEGAASEERRPEELTGEEMALTSAEAGGEARPTDPPPEPAAMDAVGAWQNNKKITALWCINQSRNAFVGVAGIGWKKLANTSDSAIVAMTLLAGHARQTQSPVNYREEADGMLHELYVW